jgi:hypothetical protein
MSKNGAAKKLQKTVPIRRKLSSLPPAILEIEPEFLMAARLAGSRAPGVRRIRVTGLDAGAPGASSGPFKVASVETLGQKLRDVSKGMGRGPFGLLVPDSAVRVNILTFEALPAKSKELEALLRWKIKDSLGFPPEQGTLSYQVIWRDAQSIEVLVVTARTDILAQYEQALDAVKAEAALVLPATLALLPLLPEDETGAQLLTHVFSGWVTHAGVTGSRLRFWRSRRLDAGDARAAIAEAVSEAARAAASMSDRLGLELGRAWYCIRPGVGESLVPELERVLGRKVEPVPAGVALDGALTPEEKALFLSFGAPIAGLIANSRRAA